jgi:glucose-6-phosphate 1-dehydrogenase
VDRNSNHNPTFEAFIEGVAEKLSAEKEKCPGETVTDCCTLVIIGASGDLTQRKLIPALFHLYLIGGLPEPFLIVGCARTQMSSENFRARLQESMAGHKYYDGKTWESFASFLRYRALEYDAPSDFEELAGQLKGLDEQYGMKGNRIFYMAIPPTLYEATVRMLGSAGLAEEHKNGNGWSRIVVEKPFGRDLQTATALERSLHEHFQEHQIFRIDHYLAKETVQNVLMFRFANAIFEPLWNRRYIDSIHITASESIGIENRAGYYEQSGVLRDMFQNHMMQLLALTAMEPPSLFEAATVLDEKAKLYKALRPFPLDGLQEFIVLGQYDAGNIDGKRVPAYLEEKGVAANSLTPTYAVMKVFIDNWRWQGVPFYLISGKRLAKKVTEIMIQFREVPHSMFRRVLGEDIRANRLVLGIYPEEKITLTFQTKYPGARVCLRSVTMDFLYHQEDEGPLLDAYEKVLLDVMTGDHMLFWRQDGVMLSWSFLTPVLKECETCRNRAEMLLPYEAGSWGPEGAKRLTEQDYLPAHRGRDSLEEEPSAPEFRVKGE